MLTSTVKFTMLNVVCTTLLLFRSNKNSFVSSSHIDHRSNYCDLRKKIVNGEVTRRNALIGSNISISVVQDYGTYPGTNSLNKNYIGLLIFEEIAQRAKFNYEEFYGIMQLPKNNETWTDVLYSSTKMHDVAVDWFTHSLERVEKGIIFAENWYDTSLIIIQEKLDDSKIENKNPNTISWFGFLYPFTWSVWSVIMICIIVTGLVYHAIELMSCGRDRKKVKNDVSDDIYYSFLASTGQNYLDPHAFPNRIMLISFLFMFIIIVAEYTSNLTSFLVNQNRIEIISEFRDAIKNNYRVCLWKGSPSVYRIKNDYPTGRFIEKSKEIETYQALLNDECDIALGFKSSFKSYLHKEEYNPKCNIETIGSDVTMDMSSFALMDSEEHCTSTLREILDIYLLEMMKDGTLQKIIEIDQKSTTNNCSIKKQNNEETHRLNLSDISGVFLFHFMWTVVAVILAIIKFLLSWRHGNKAMNKVQKQKKRKKQNPTLEVVDLVISLKDELKEVRREMNQMRKTINAANTSDLEKPYKGYL